MTGARIDRTGRLGAHAPLSNLIPSVEEHRPL